MLYLYFLEKRDLYSVFSRIVRSLEEEVVVTIEVSTIVMLFTISSSDDGTSLIVTLFMTLRLCERSEIMARMGGPLHVILSHYV